MKVLWFSLSPCGSMRRKGSNLVIQGWMISLEDHIKNNPDIDLHVAFLSDVENEAFCFEGVHYYPIFHSKSKNPVKRVLERKASLSKIDARLLPAMLKIVEESKPDLIHIHGTEERFGLIAKHISGIPVVYSIQGLLAPYAEKYFSGMPDKDIFWHESLYDKVKLVSYRNEYENFCKRAEREKAFLKDAEYILGRTFWDEYVTGLLNPERKYYVVDEILRCPFYNLRWDKQRFTEGRIKIVSTISGGIYKGYEVVLKTASLLKRYSGIGFEWSIAGYDGQDKWIKIAEKLTNIKSKEVNVVLKGLLDAPELSELLVDSDLYLQVSHIENSPNSVCEAMLVGMPVIASFSGGTASLLDNGLEGILVQDGDPYVLAGAVVELSKRFDLAKKYGENARRRALARHNRERISSCLADVYNKILEDYKKHSHEDSFC